MMALRGPSKSGLPVALTNKINSGARLGVMPLGRRSLE